MFFFGRVFVSKIRNHGDLDKIEYKARVSELGVVSGNSFGLFSGAARVGASFSGSFFHGFEF